MGTAGEGIATRVADPVRGNGLGAFSLGVQGLDLTIGDLRYVTHR
jgi:hypothetical protein